MVLGASTVLGDPVELDQNGLLARGVVRDPVLGEQACLDALRELDFLLGVQQRDLADLLQVVLDRVGSGTRHHDLLLGLVGVVALGEREPGVGLELLVQFGLGLGRLGEVDGNPAVLDDDLVGGGGGGVVRPLGGALGVSHDLLDVLDHVGQVDLLVDDLVVAGSLVVGRRTSGRGPGGGLLVTPATAGGLGPCGGAAVVISRGLGRAGLG